MTLRLRSLSLLATTWLAAMGLLASGAQATVIQVDRHAYGVSAQSDLGPSIGPVGNSSLVTSATSRLGASGATTDTGQLTYHGGPVLHSSAPYLIFWAPSAGTGIPAGEQSLLTRYFTDVAEASGSSSDVYAVGRQFTDATGYAANQHTFSAATQVVLDTQAFPAIDTTNCSHTVPGEYTRCLTDAQLTSEVRRIVSARGLPNDGLSGAAPMPANAPVYFVVLPADVNVCYPGACADTDFCAYHSYLTSGANTILYVVLPTISFAAGQNPKSCQWDGMSAVQEPNGDPGDVVAKYASHEDNEAITDPLLNAWYDDASGNENGDNCNYYSSSANPAAGGSPFAFAPTLGGDAAAGTLFNQTINGHPYYLQTEWSNGDAACEPGASGASLTPAFTTQTTSGNGLTFDPSGSAAADGISSATWSFGDGSATSFRASAQATTTISHTYATAGTYTATLTLVDGGGDVATVSRSVLAGPLPAPTATVVTAHPGTGQSTDFTASSGWSSYAWTFGDGSTAQTSSTTTSHVYSTPGTYAVGLTVTDSNGRTATTSTGVTVAGPSPVLAVTPATAGSASSFAATGSRDSGGGITGYAWSFGDAASAATASAQHVYATAGAYTVTLTLTDASGYTASATSVVTIAAAAPAAPSGGTTTTITTTTTPTKSTTPTKTTTPPKANSASVSGYAASAAPAATSVRLTAGGAAKAWKPGQRIAVRVGATVVHPTAAQVRSLGRRGVVRLAVKGKRGRTRTLVLRVRRRHRRRYVSARLAG